MSGRPTRVPGADHSITIAPANRHVVVSAGGHVIADTRDALTLQESTYPPVLYIPREDADMAALQRTAHSSHCPYKGDASYYSIPGLDRGTNAIWTYETPADAVAAIKEHLAFYPDRVKIEVRAD